MPDAPPSKRHLHPYRLMMTTGTEGGALGPLEGARDGEVRYVELAVTSNFTFLTGASHPEEFVEEAAAQSHAAASIADTNTLGGIVRAHVAAKERGIPVAIGCRLRFVDPSTPEIIVYPTTRPAYSRLCGLLTQGKRKAPKGECYLTLDDLMAREEDMLAIVVPARGALGARGDEVGLGAALGRLREVFDGDRLSIGAARRYEQDDAELLGRTAAIGREHGVAMVAINDVRYHHPGRRPLQDVVTCIRHGCTIHEGGFRLAANAERHLKSPEEMGRLFAEYPGAIARTWEIASRAIGFSLDEIRYEYPAEPCPDGMTPYEYLVDRTWEGAGARYPGGVPEKVVASVKYELAMIKELRYEPYFLTCYDIIRFARGRGILCQGRGGAANSAVCYCLGITEVDPSRFNLLFERFVSRARNEPPDIDIDFEHERREEVIQYLYAKYGRDRAALTAEVISYRGRSSLREVGKAMGLSLDCVDLLAKHMDVWGQPASAERVREAGLNPEDPTIAQVLELSAQLGGFPRHLSQHVGGFVITRTALEELVPIENAAMEDRTIIEWDKDDIDAMGMLKIDVLGLGMLTCIRKAFDLVRGAGGGELSIPRVMGELGEDADVYAMIQAADTVGVFQIESRAQMSMLPRLRPACFYDLVIEVAIVRPGPIQGKMVHPYLKRRNGEEQVTFPSDAVREVLGRTLGVPLFQEQAMQLAIVAAGFTPDEADELRRAMAAWRRKGDKLSGFSGRFIGGMIANGYPEEFAQRCFGQLRGFSEYGFPESHAASFAILVYVSCWLKHYHPEAFAAALINSQPMGFYQPSQIVRDAREHGAVVRGVDVNFSGWDCTLELIQGAGGEGGVLGARAVGDGKGASFRARPALAGGKKERPPATHALRLGMRQVKGLKEADARLIEGCVAEGGACADVATLWRLSSCSVASLKRLAAADAFGSMGLDRRSALWEIEPLRDEELPLFAALDPTRLEEEVPALPAMAPRMAMLEDYQHTGLSLEAHPLQFLREGLEKRKVVRCGDLRDRGVSPDGRSVEVAGTVLVRQRPGTASGVVFITLEDETGIANLIVWPKVFEHFRRVARMSTILLARGKVERQGDVVHVHVSFLESLDGEMEGMESVSRDFH